MICIAYYGYFEIMSKLNSPKYTPSQVVLDPETNEVLDNDDLEGVTILRPIKGIDPELELCLESCLLQKYPVNKMQILFCVESSNDPAVPIIERLLKRHSDKDAELLIDDQLPDEPHYFGPNPKVNNLAKGYKLAKFDIIWILDSNVWVNPGTLARSVISLNYHIDNGRQTYDPITGKGTPIKLVHHTPLAVAIDNENSTINLGAKLDEMFLLTSHAKFYVFFNKASIAPCVNGKSNIYRRSSLDFSVKQITQNKVKTINSENIAIDALQYVQPGEGIRFFSKYIGEDNMIGIALWENEQGGRTGMTGDVVVQPIGDNLKNGIWDYINRRVRWLRVRRYMVLAATLVEPTTESLVIGLFGSFGASNLFFGGKYQCGLLLLNEIIWCFTDYTQYQALLNYSNKDTLCDSEQDTPFFLNFNKVKFEFSRWLPIWILREVLALPIWIIAMCGTSIDWRNRPFKIKADLSAEAL